MTIFFLKMSCNIFQYSRFPLKQDEEQENAEFMFQQKKPQFQTEKEPCGGSVEWAQHLDISTVTTELKALERALRQVNKLWVKFLTSESLIGIC